MSLQVILALLFNAVLAAVCGAALVRGGRPERVGAVINLTASSVTTALRLWHISYFAPMDLVIVSIDLVVAGGFFWLGVTTTRFWPIWAAGFALANLFMNFCSALMPNIPLFAFHTGLGIYAYLALGALGLGTYRLPRNAEPHLRDGSRRSWLRHLKKTS